MSKISENYRLLEDNMDYVRTHTRRETMEKFGLSYDSVANFCHKYGIESVRERRRHSRYVTEELVEFAKDHTVAQIAKKFNWNYGFTRSLLKRHDIKHVLCVIKDYSSDNPNLKKGHNLRKGGEFKEMIYELSKKFTHASIARSFGYSRERIRQICSDFERSQSEENN